MDTEHAAALSKQILDGCLSAEPGQRVWINSWDHTLKLGSDLAWESRQRGCQVLLTVQPEDLWLRSMIGAPLELVDNLPAHLVAALEETDIYIFTLGPRKPIPWNTIPAERRKSVSVWLDTRYDKSKFAEQWAIVARKRKVKMLAIEATLATQERAEEVGLDLEKWKQVMFEGCTADPKEMASHGRELEPLMSGEGQVRVTTPFGTDLRFKLDKRPLDYSYGLATEEKAERGEVLFLPTGGIEVSAAEDSAEGRIVYDTSIRSGKGKVESLTLQVSQGRIKQFSARSGREIFERYLREGTGDENRFGYFGFGLNPKLRYGFTQDDKVLGSTIVGFGHSGAKEGKNVASGQWWASMTKATVTISGQKVMEDGKLLVKS
jgi:leucyl aminopeptidase (aminopeptidase T)